MEEDDVMTEGKVLDIRLLIAESNGIERRMAIVARMSADRPHLNEMVETESPQDDMVMRRGSA
ncbi:MAG: hypothetical protein ACFFC0_00980 [Promethearchaeota archaeon]